MVESDHVSMVYLLGDLNINLLCNHDSTCLYDVLDPYNMENIIEEPTCSMSENATLLDVIFTNNVRRIAATINVTNSISDFHNLTGFSTKIHVPRKKNDFVSYRSYKNFDENAFKHDLATAPFSVADIFDDLDDIYWFHSTLISDVIECHAPLKKRKPVRKPVPFMNAKLRKACHKKAMLRNKFFKWGRTNKQWELYRKSRNAVDKIKAASMSRYFEERCNKAEGNGNGRMFWDAVKPFFTDNIKLKNESISLKDGDNIVNDPHIVSNLFNDYFTNITKEYGCEDPITEDEDIHAILLSYNNHESINSINAKFPNPRIFSFGEITTHDVYKLIKSMDHRKATGYDNIPPKLLKVAPHEFALPVTSLINNSIKRSCFPSGLKCSEIAPLFKASDNLLKENYRPVSVLPCISKLFEKTYHEQMYAHFQEILSSILAAFRKRYSCNHVLTKLVEDCKISLDRRENVGLILTDLSKAFDCLPHRLLLCKLYNYGVSLEACQLVRSYLCNRRQRVKIGCTKSQWTIVERGVPQGSVLGPLLFNVFINDIVYKLEGHCSIYNYADDNTLRFSHRYVPVLKDHLEICSGIAVNWFKANHMKANPGKFQLLLLKSDQSNDNISINLFDETITPKNSVKLLGVHLDDKLNFERHISEICIRASRKINALSRISKFLNVQCRTKLFNAFVKSNFVYANIVWHFCSKRCVYKIEKLQKRAIRIVFNEYDSTYTQLREKMKCQTLYLSRIHAIVMEVFKCVTKRNTQFMNEMFTLADHGHDTRSGRMAIQPMVNTVYHGLNSFSYEGAKLWNSLPSDIKKCDNLQEFKMAVKNWTGPRCECGTCILCTISRL
jgi:hypothetical protein